MPQQHPLPLCDPENANNGLPLSGENRQDETPLTAFLVDKSLEFRELLKIRQIVSNDAHAEKHYKFKHKSRPAKCTPEQQNSLLMTKRHMCSELDKDEGILQILGDSRQPRVLEMGMARGCFSNYILECYPDTQITGISMPEKDRGYPVSFGHKNIKSLLRDVSMLAGDLGVDGIPDTHPTFGSLTTERLLPADEVYDLVICQEQPGIDLSREKSHFERGPWSDSLKYQRIQTAQLVIAMEHLKEGGTIVVLLRKPETLRTASLLRSFWAFSELSLFKHTRLNQKTPSFFMVAKKVQTRSEEALAAISTWRQRWKEMTLAKDGGTDRSDEVEDVPEYIENFGARLLEMANVVWSIQADGLKSFLEKVHEKPKQRRSSERRHARKRQAHTQSSFFIPSAA